MTSGTASPRPAPTRTPSGIAYWTLGDGPPLLAVHGGPGTDHSFFRPALEPLADVATVVFFDLPGHGASAPPADFALATMAGAIDDVRVAIGADRVVLLGSSYGGFLSLIFALAHPERVAGLIFVDTSASYGFREESLQEARRRGTPEILAALARLWDGSLSTDREFHDDWRTILPLYFHRLPLDAVRRLADRGSYNLDTRKRILPTFRGYDVRARLAEIEAPALVLAGRHDWITAVGQACELAEGLRSAELHIFEDSGHYPFIEEPDAFLAAVRCWLRRLASDPHHDGS